MESNVEITIIKVFFSFSGDFHVTVVENYFEILVTLIGRPAVIEEASVGRDILSVKNNCHGDSSGFFHRITRPQRL